MTAYTMNRPKARDVANMFYRVDQAGRRRWHARLHWEQLDDEDPGWNGYFHDFYARSAEKVEAKARRHIAKLRAEAASFGPTIEVDDIEEST